VEPVCRWVNETIEAAALSNGGALVDIHEIFSDVVEDGLAIGGIEYEATLFGGLFSYDGVHASPTGYGVIANAFIDAINARFVERLPSIDLSGLLFGPEGDLGPRGQPIAASAGSAVLMENLREVLDLRSTKKLKRLAKKQERKENRANAGTLRVDREERRELRKERRQERRATRAAA
jgi:hypothetical protein